MAASAVPAEDSWFVTVEGQSYGPYTDEQVTAFVREGRISQQTPVRRGREPWIIAGLHAQLMPAFTDANPAPAGEAPASEEEKLAKIVIIAELRTGSSTTFEAAVARLGSSYRLNQFVWFVHTSVPFSQLRKELMGVIGRNDPLFISDTTNRRSSWINFGPGAEATISALWRGAKAQ